MFVAQKFVAILLDCPNTLFISVSTILNKEYERKAFISLVKPISFHFYITIKGSYIV